MSVQNIHFLRPPSSIKKRKNQHFFKWIICHENNNKWAEMLKVYQHFVSIDSPPERVCFVHLL